MAPGIRRPPRADLGTRDEVNDTAVEGLHPIKDHHVALLHLLGLDEAKLTYLVRGRDKQLSQTGDALIRELVA